MGKVEIIPAIDLMKGNVVRLTQGDPEKATLYQALGRPVEIAERWINEGARYLHVIDLDAAMDLGNNRAHIREIARNVETHIQVGGGIRRQEDIDDIVCLGVDRVILGTLAMEKAETLMNSLAKFGSNRIVVALDYKGDHIVVRGWKKDTGCSVKNALSKFIKLGIRTFLMTSVSRDGLLTGPDLETLGKCTQNRFVSILAAGGVGSLGDLRRLKATGVAGVVVGKALYEGRFKLKEALSLV